MGATYVASLEAARWLVATLAAAGPVSAIFGAGGSAKVYSELAPPGTVGPYVILQQQAPPKDVYAAGRPGGGGSSNYRVLTRCFYVVKVVGQVYDYADLEAGYKAVDAALDNQSGPTSVARVSCSRDGEVAYTEPDGPVPQWRHLGGSYVLIVSSL
jgi:hypothetical protein